MIKLLKTSIKFFLPALLFTLLFFQSPVSAQILNNNSLSLGFAPTSQFLKMKPGQKFKGEATVWNLSPQTRTFNIIVRGFSQLENIPGTAKLNTESQELRDPFSAASWLKVSYKKVFLVSNQYTKIPFEINVPSDAATGEFHAMIFLVTDTQQSELGQNSTSNSNLGSGPVVFIKIGDKVDEKAEIEYFRTEKPFYELPPVTFLTRYINKGNTHITPAGDILLENFLGQQIDHVTFNENKQSLLRGNSGNYEDIWDHDGIFFRNGKLAIGPIKARLITTYLSENPGYAPLNAVTTYWVLPWKHILAILVIAGIMYRIILHITKRDGQKSRKDSAPEFNYPRYA